jgi:hypothetical protein
MLQSENCGKQVKSTILSTSQYSSLPSSFIIQLSSLNWIRIRVVFTAFRPLNEDLWRIKLNKTLKIVNCIYSKRSDFHGPQIKPVRTYIYIYDRSNRRFYLVNLDRSFPENDSTAVQRTDL